MSASKHSSRFSPTLGLENIRELQNVIERFRDPLRHKKLFSIDESWLPQQQPFLAAKLKAPKLSFLANLEGAKKRI